MATDTYDAIVVGGRIAGAATAVLLAQQGERVLLLERATMPAPTVSCPIFFGSSLRVMNEMGVLGAVEAIGAPRITLYGFRAPAFDMVAKMPDTFGYDYAYSIRREVLDTAILDVIRRNPLITVRENFSVSGVIRGGERVVGVRGRQGHGPEEALFARGVIGADGKRSIIARAVKAETYAGFPGDTAIFYAYYRNIVPLAEPSAVVYADPTMQRGVLVFDADAGLTVISVGVPKADFAEARKDPETVMKRYCDEIPEVAERMKHAERATPVMGQGPLDSYYRQSFGPGWALVGDAAHYVDPITGQGINNALTGASLLADAWAQTRRRASWMTAMAQYQRRRDAATRPLYDMVAAGAALNQQSSPLVQEIGQALGTMMFRAISRSPEDARRYVGMLTGSTPVHQFMNPLNLARIVANDTIRHELPRMLARVPAST